MDEKFNQNSKNIIENKDTKGMDIPDEQIVVIDNFAVNDNTNSNISEVEKIKNTKYDPNAENIGNLNKKSKKKPKTYNFAIPKKECLKECAICPDRFDCDKLKEEDYELWQSYIEEKKISESAPVNKNFFSFLIYLVIFLLVSVGLFTLIYSLLK